MGKGFQLLRSLRIQKRLINKDSEIASFYFLEMRHVVEHQVRAKQTPRDTEAISAMLPFQQRLR